MAPRSGRFFWVILRDIRDIRSNYSMFCVYILVHWYVVWSIPVYCIVRLHVCIDCDFLIKTYMYLAILHAGTPGLVE